MRNVKGVLERYRKGEISVGDVARALKISLLHAKRIISQAQQDISTNSQQPSRGRK